MTLNDFEQIRKRYFPKYLTFLALSMIVMVLAVIFLIFFQLELKWWQFLIIAASAISIVFTFIIVADQIEKNYLKKYGPIFEKEFIDPLIMKTFGSDLIDKTEPLKLSGVKLIGKSHKYQILSEIHTNDYSIYEISMLKDFRFKGFVIKKEVKDFKESFTMTNYNYYFKPKISDFKISAGIPNFDNKYLLYSADLNFQLDKELANNLLKKLSGFKNIGLTVEDNKAYFVLGVSSREVNLRLPLVDTIDDNYYKKMHDFMRKLKEIAQFEINIS